MVSLPSKSGGRSYEQMAAGMREAPTFAIAERVIEQDFKVKLPDRRYIQLWNTPEIGQFRGYQEDLDEAEEGRAQHAREQMEIQQAARETGASAPDMGVVHEMLSHQRQQQEAMRAHVEDLNRIQSTWRACAWSSRLSLRGSRRRSRRPRGEPRWRSRLWCIFGTSIWSTGA